MSSLPVRRSPAQLLSRISRESLLTPIFKTSQQPSLPALRPPSITEAQLYEGWKHVIQLLNTLYKPGDARFLAQAKTMLTEYITFVKKATADIRSSVNVPQFLVEPDLTWRKMMLITHPTPLFKDNPGLLVEVNPDLVCISPFLVR